MKQSGSADLTLMGGNIPNWLFDRMKQLSLPMVEVIVEEYGQQGFLSRLSDPFWFQSFGAVIGMDWNSSGVTTAIMRALKQAINPHAKELGLFVCGGKGKESTRTPQELMRIGDLMGLDAGYLTRCSKLTAKVDNTAVQDGFQLYIHNFILSSAGDWTVIQQGMKTKDQSARRYHWHSEGLTSFVEDPQAAICGEDQGEIINLVDKRALPTQQAILGFTKEDPAKTIKELPKLLLANNPTMTSKDVDLKRLGSILWLAEEQQTANFEELLLLKGMGPRTLQSLALVSEVIHGTPSRFSDPARYSFAHGGKRGTPFPVLTKVYDETISTLRSAVDRAKIGQRDKSKAIEKLHKIAVNAEKGFTANDNFEQLVNKENREAYRYGGRTKKGFVPPPTNQLNLFD